MVHLTPWSQFGKFVVLLPATTKWSTSGFGIKLAMLLCYCQQPQSSPPQPDTLLAIQQYRFATTSKHNMVLLTHWPQFGMFVVLLPTARNWSTSGFGINLAILLCYRQQPQNNPPQLDTLFAIRQYCCHQQPLNGPLRFLFASWQCCIATASNHNMVHLESLSQFGNVALLRPATTKWLISSLAPNLAI